MGDKPFGRARGFAFIQPNMNYTPTIGLELHAELKTLTKMFCNSKNDPNEERPNVNVCPICLGHPGTLPTINKEAVKHILKIGLAVGGQLADFSEFDRKNYFYPDISKGYQISQYKRPLVQGGELAGVKLTRIHLEEDTATSLHDVSGASCLNFNRAGVPLMELVTEPVIKDAKTAVRFAKELQLLLRYLGIAEANMEKGEMRVEANISVSRGSALGTKVEVKNLNSFKSVEKAIEYEVKRQVKELEDGGRVAQETMGWDDNEGVSFPQRRKEESHDYRYFPDPDLPKLRIKKVPEFDKLLIQQGLPELPHQKRACYLEKWNLRPEVAEIFVQNTDLGGFFESVARKMTDNQANLAANYIASDLAGLLNLSVNVDLLSTIKIDPEDFATIIVMVEAGKKSSRGAKDLIRIVFERGGNPEDVAKETGLIQESGESALARVAEETIKQNPKVASDYQNGKEAALQFLVGQGMKISRGSANPEILRLVLKKKL